MLGSKRAVMAAGVTALLAAAVLAAPARAVGIKGACLVTGEAKMFDKENPSVGVRLEGGKGLFVFDGSLLCVASRKGSPNVDVLGVAARGVYNNVVCGTGKAWGTITDVSGPLKYQVLLERLKFAIHFVSREGVFFWHRWAKTNLPDLKDITLIDDGGSSKTQSEKEWQAAGWIDLSPPHSKPPTAPDGETCTKAFWITGVVGVHEPL